MISRTAKLKGVTVCGSIEDALQRAQLLSKTIFISGGRSIDALGIPLATGMLLSTIKGHHEGDVDFPHFDANDWMIAQEADRGEYILRDYRRRPRTRSGQ